MAPSAAPAPSDPASRKLSLHLSSGASKIIHADEARLLVKWAWMEMEQNPEVNHFKFEKLGIYMTREGDSVWFMTPAEHASALSETKKE